MKTLYAILFAVVLGAIYALGYYLNHKTPVPEGCEDLKSECSGCRITSCEMHPAHDIKGDNENA
ncbi:MAG: hypothetical protein HUJ56_08250 [Erysipelotrichaceae bacterium]|nr:hypothetical protein [Erysipelotrichaceae bacterium]